MRTANAKIKRAAEDLVERAEECFDRAETQHKVADLQQESADLQHENAEHIAALGHALEADAAELLGEAEIRSVPDTTPLKPSEVRAAARIADNGD